MVTTYMSGEPKGTATSAYLPHDADEPRPIREMRVITDYISRRKQLITGCDANAHFIWVNTGTSPRGESLMEYLVSSSMNILNQGNKPILVISNRKEIIGL
jgi:hypothetical protein